jgi:hypothetical protein
MDAGRFSEIWVADFEFQSAAGERSVPICMVAHELVSGRTLRLWGDELVPKHCPYSTGPDVLFVAYYASAEMGCHLALEWPLPSNVLDLYAEFRVETNGKILPVGNGLLGALEYYGHNGISAREKDAMRELILRGGPYSAGERLAILDYCESDVTATCTLLQSMMPIVSPATRLGQALLRGRYTKAVAHMEWHGIPIDGELLCRLRDNWGSLQDELIARVDLRFGVYEGRTFKLARFAQYLQSNGIAWPRLASGRLALDDDTFGEQCKIHPELRPLKELRHALGQMRLNDLAVGKDDRNRTMLSMFRSKTGRNQPSTARFVFGLPAWLRGLIKPHSGRALVYVDWSQQEFGIAAALSGDRRMQEAYSSGDPYLAFAKQAGAVPLDATKVSHTSEREQFKACVLAVQYGMQEDSLARRIRQPTVYARELLRKHRQTYKRFWEWSDGVLDYALTNRRLWTTFGWTLHVTGSPNSRSLRNFPMQANGAEMLRIACCLAIERGIRVVAPIHDAVLIEASVETADCMTAQMQECMRQASVLVLDGFELRADAKTIYDPERYIDERGTFMWNTVQELLAKRGGDSDRERAVC